MLTAGSLLTLSASRAASETRATHAARVRINFISLRGRGNWLIFECQECKTNGLIDLLMVDATNVQLSSRGTSPYLYSYTVPSLGYRSKSIEI